MTNADLIMGQMRWSRSQYALMDHYYANPLSILTEPMAPEDGDAPWTPEAAAALLTPLHAQAIRLLPSFRHYCEVYADEHPHVIKHLLTDDEALLRTAVPRWLHNLLDAHRRAGAVTCVSNPWTA